MLPSRRPANARPDPIAESGDRDNTLYVFQQRLKSPLSSAVVDPKAAILLDKVKKGRKAPKIVRGSK